MANPTTDDLTIPALTALASSPDGAMTLSALVSHLETRHGSTDEAAGSAQSAESQSFTQLILALLSQPSSGLVDRGFATTDGTGALIQITPAGRSFIGR